MNQFKSIGKMMQKIIIAYRQIRKSKAQLCKKINYDIKKLYQHILNPKYRWLLTMLRKICRSYHIDKNDMIPKSEQLFLLYCRLCEYLQVKIYQLRAHCQLNSFEDLRFIELQQIIKKQSSIISNLRQQLCQININRLFNQIDFFNNGYIDSFNLCQFFNHYLNHQQFNNEDFDWFLRIIKGSPSVFKIYIQDLNDFINKKQTPIQQIQPYYQLNNDHFTEKNKFKLKSIENSKTICQIRNSLNHLQNQQHQININSQYLNIEERLIQSNPRNKKYLKEIKKIKNKIDININICSYKVSSSFILNNLAENSKSQIIFYLRTISNIYEAKYSQIYKLIIECQEFNFLEGFNVIDKPQRKFVSIQGFIEFIKDCKLQLGEKKIVSFFKIYSKDGLMSYSDYLKIFKIKYDKQIFIKCKIRKPILSNKWDLKMIQNYSNFFKASIQLTNDLLQNRISLNKVIRNFEEYEKQLLTEEQFIGRDQIMLMIGNRCNCLLEQIFESESKLKTKNIFKKICEIK